MTDQVFSLLLYVGAVAGGAVAMWTASRFTDRQVLLWTSFLLVTVALMAALVALGIRLYADEP